MEDKQKLYDSFNTEKCRNDINLCMDNKEKEYINNFLIHRKHCDRKVEVLKKQNIDNDIKYVLSQIDEDKNIDTQKKENLKKIFEEQLKIIEKLKIYINLYNEYKNMLVDINLTVNISQDKDIFNKEFETAKKLFDKNELKKLEDLYNLNNNQINNELDNYDKNKFKSYETYFKIKNSINEYTNKFRKETKRISDTDKLNKIQEIIYNEFKILFDNLKNINIKDENLLKKLKNIVSEDKYKTSLKDLIKKCEEIINYSLYGNVEYSIEGCGLDDIKNYKQLKEERNGIKNYITELKNK
jgi:hypothetical protein